MENNQYIEEFFKLSEEIEKELIEKTGIDPELFNILDMYFKLKFIIELSFHEPGCSIYAKHRLKEMRALAQELMKVITQGNGSPLNKLHLFPREMG